MKHIVHNMAFKAKYDDKGEGIKYGYAKYLRDALPNATFVGFTGTPVASTDKNTQMVSETISMFMI